jgi:DNA repair protein RadC
MEPVLLSDLELLGRLIGPKQAAKIYQGKLKPLFSESRRGVHYQKLAVARELIRRAIEEELVRESALNSPRSVAEYLKVWLGDKEHECFTVLYLDAQHRLIKAEELFRGTLTQTSVYPREVVKRALQWNSAAVIFAHNHPSGVAEPSRADELLTQALKAALDLVDIKVLDHLIVAGNATISFAEKGRM